MRFIGEHVALAKKMVSYIFLAAFVVCVLYYALQVWYRHSPNIWYEQVSDVNEGAYTVRYAYVAENWISLKIYKTGENQLLAERTYQFVGPADFTWVNNKLIYDMSDNSFYYDGLVNLPPTKIDRLLAYLP